MERKAASAPGTLFFIRPIYADDTDRPRGFEVGVQSGDELIVDVFENPNDRASSTQLGVLRRTTAFNLNSEDVERCLDRTSTADSLFVRGWHTGPGRLTRAERCAVACVTGHVAESVAEILLDSLGWRVLWHFTGPGRHGVDLVFYAPGDVVVAVEVKGSLVAGRIPRLSHRELSQMSAAWIDKKDNPGIAELNLDSTDVYGGLLAVNFADSAWCMALSADFAEFYPILGIDQLADLTWLRS